jgi:hypothetical protein
LRGAIALVEPAARAPRRARHSARGEVWIDTRLADRLGATGTQLASATRR